jgi:hypothetical protein
MLAEQKETTAVFKDSVLDVEYPPDQEAGAILNNYPGATGLEARQPDGSNVGSDSLALPKSLRVTSTWLFLLQHLVTNS